VARKKVKINMKESSFSHGTVHTEEGNPAGIHELFWAGGVAESMEDTDNMLHTYLECIGKCLDGKA
jgi:hypothetical protein